MWLLAFFAGEEAIFGLYLTAHGLRRDGSRAPVLMIGVVLLVRAACLRVLTGADSSSEPGRLPPLPAQV